MEKNDILLKIKACLLEIKSKYHVKNIGIFGSYARNEQNESSDVDILVEFSSPISFFEYIELEDYLSNFLNLKVDLVSKKAVKKILQHKIYRETIYATK